MEDDMNDGAEPVDQLEPSFGLAVHGDPAGDHVVSILQNGRVERLSVRGILGRAIAFHGGLASLLEMIRSIGVPVASEPVDLLEPVLEPGESTSDPAQQSSDEQKPDPTASTDAAPPKPELDESGATTDKVAPDGQDPADGGAPGGAGADEGEKPADGAGALDPAAKPEITPEGA